MEVKNLHFLGELMFTQTHLWVFYKLFHVQIEEYQGED
jgi:hypothetical protein